MFVRFGMQGMVLAGAVLLSQACRFEEANPRHCSNNDGNAYCNRVVREYGAPELYCQLGTPDCSTEESRYGCVEDEPLPQCYSPCGERSTLDENGECIPIEEPASSTSSGGSNVEPSTSEEGSATGGPCGLCEDATPFCVDGRCVSCDATADHDAACAELDAGTPVCWEGKCVQCTAEDQAACNRMLCDVETNTCTPCVEHEQCEESRACELDEGRCFPPDVVVHVGDYPGANFPDIITAIGAINDGEHDILGEEMHAVIIVHSFGNGDPYTGTTIVEDGKVVALLASDGTEPVLALAGESGLLVRGNEEQATALYLQGLNISNNTAGRGLTVNDAVVWMDRCRIVENDDGGIRAENGAELTVRSSFVGAVADTNAIEVIGDATTASIHYATIGAGGNNSIGLRCESPMSVVVRDSLIVARGESADSLVQRHRAPAR
jgi:hypothetical protein